MDHVMYLAEKGSAPYQFGQALGPVCLLVVVLLIAYGLYRVFRGKK
jgi:hypothetical protein